MTALYTFAEGFAGTGRELTEMHCNIADQRKERESSQPTPIT